eukprot:TRINITY_DN39374_c0_g1_i1.p1 TRINITY_DN39374_c0_g1~~TRINITY_DN39374_c0_g1_i1.p1  ORF type:complete len:673 (+),score=172.18 TRINITY_DN39374_c0_g1_i1:97-2115(+)
MCIRYRSDVCNALRVSQVLCPSIASAMCSEIAKSDSGLICISSFAEALLALSPETWGDRSARALCTLVAVEKTVGANVAELSIDNLADWVVAYNCQFSSFVSAVLAAIPHAEACAALELAEEAPLADLIEQIAADGIYVDAQEARQRAVTVFRGVARMLDGDAPTDTVPEVASLHDLKMFGGTTEGWEALNSLTRLSSRAPQWVRTQFVLMQESWPYGKAGLQELLSSFKARGTHFMRGVNLRVLKNRLYSDLRDSKGVSKLLAVAGSVLPIDSKRILMEPQHWAIVVAALCVKDASCLGAEDRTALATLVFSGADSNGDGWISEADLNTFLAELHHYGMSLLGALLFEINFFDRSLSGTGAKEYHTLAREIDAKYRARAPGSDLEISAPCHTVFSKIARGAEMFDGSGWQVWVTDNTEEFCQLVSLSRPELFEWLEPAAPIEEPAASEALSSQDDVQLAVRAVVGVLRDLGDALGDVDNTVLEKVFSTDELNPEAMDEDEALSGLAELCTMAVRQMQRSGKKSTPFRFGFISSVLAFVELSDLDLRATLAFLAIDQSSAGRITRADITAFLHNLSAFGTSLAICLLRRDQQNSPEQNVMAAAWVEVNGVIAQSSDLLTAIFDGLVKVVCVGKGVSRRDAQDEVEEDGVSMRTWMAWAVAHPKEVKSLTAIV